MKTPILTLHELNRDLRIYGSAIATIDAAFEALRNCEALPGATEAANELMTVRRRLNAARVAHAEQPVFLGSTITTEER